MKSSVIPNAFEEAGQAMQLIDQALLTIKAFRDEKAIEIAKYIRMNKGIELDPDAIQATLIRPYTILPINEQEAWLIQSKIVKMPVVGWVVANEEAFIKSKISRSMEWFTPFPKYIKDEMGWKPPEHKAVIDGTRTGIYLTEGEEDTFKKKYGAFLNGSGPDGQFRIKGGDAWIKLVASLVSDGILPYQPKPVQKEHWDAKAQISDNFRKILESLEWKKKRPYLQRAVDQWREDGASTFNLPPGAGKSLIIMLILTYFRGRVLLFGDTTSLIEQWRDTLSENVPGANVTVSTYQGAQKYMDEEWDLIIFDEAQRLPANSFSKLAFLKTHYRAGATGTAWREDQRQHLIVALCGKPFYIPWEEFIAADILKKPRITVVTVPNEAAKTTFVKSLIAKRKGRALVFCDYIEKGKALADSLKVPFVYGETSNKLEKIRENDVCVVSRVADRGISLRDLRLVIEVAGAGKSREQFGQRLGRLLHGEFEGQFFTIFTPDEIRKYRGRIFGVEAELAGQVDIEFIEIGNIKEVDSSPRSPRSTPSRPVARKASPAAKSKPLDEIGQVLAIPAIAAKIDKAKDSVGVNSKSFIERTLRYCWDTALSPQDIVEGLGNTNKNARGEVAAACKANVQAGLMVVNSEDQYRVDRGAIERLKTLSEIRKK